MSKLFSITLSLIIFTQSLGMTINDVVQIDEFIEHAKFHSQQYGDNVLVFISKHYGDLKADHEKEHQEEKEDHEQLPFKHHSISTSQLVFIFHTDKEEFGKTLFQKNSKTYFHYLSLFSSLHKRGLFQPPKQV